MTDLTPQFREPQEGAATVIDPKLFDRPNGIPQERESRRTRQIGETYQPDPGMERLIELRDRDPITFARNCGSNAVIRTALYEEQKQAAKQIGLI